MTPASALQLVKTLCKDPEFIAFGFWPASIMAFIQIESSFDERAIHYEPALGESSYGLMQILLSTARWLGFTGDIPNGLFDPETNVRLGMRYLRWGWHYLERKSRQTPTVEQWAAGYNEGYGRALRDADPDYVAKWLAARGEWLSQ